MSHLDEGALQAYLDDEVEPRHRAAVAEHLIGCLECRDSLESLRSARALFSGAMADLDLGAPAERAWRVVEPAASDRSRSGGSFVRAAGLVLLLAAAASAAAPGSPVREWLTEFVGGAAAPSSEGAEAAASGAIEGLASPAGVALTEVGDRVVIEVTGLKRGGIRLIETGSSNVSVRASGGTRDPIFRTGAGRIEVTGGEGGELTVSWPESVNDARLRVDGRLYAARVDGALHVLVDPSAELDGALVWR